MDAEDDIYLNIGMIVLESQSVEKFLKYILTMVLQDGTPVTYARILELDELYDKKTLGYFIAEMKERAKFTEDLEPILDRFLMNRNKLIHRFAEIDGHTMSTEIDIAKVHSFLDQLSQDIMFLLKFFAAWILEWRKRNGRPALALLSKEPPKGCEAHILEIIALCDRIDHYIIPKS